MKVFCFDLLPYGEELDHLKEEGSKELPWPLLKRHFKPEVAARTYEEHLQVWEEMDRLGYDGVGFNEHHTSPYGLMNSPNLMAAAAQRTKNLKLLIYGNLLPVHDPLRLAEELSMLDCMSNGRLISGFARGIPRELEVYGVPHTESRDRFEEAWEIIERAWTEEVFSFEGRFWSYNDVALWPRPIQQPRPPVWIPITSSKESIEWTGAHDMPITPGAGSRGLREDVIRYYAKCLAAAGHQITPDHLIRAGASLRRRHQSPSPGRSRPPCPLLQPHPVQPRQHHRGQPAARHGLPQLLVLRLRQAGDLPAVARAREDYRDLTIEQLAKQVETQPWGPGEEVTERIIESAEHAGSNIVLVILNRGVMPYEMFLNQVQRFAREVLPSLQAHEVKEVPLG